MKAKRWKALVSCALAALMLGGMALASEPGALLTLKEFSLARPWEIRLPVPSSTPGSTPARGPVVSPAPSETPPPPPEPTLPLQTQEEGVLSLLLIGVDSHGSGSNGRSDTVILARLNAKTGEIKLVSFLRDLYVKIPGRGKTRLNAAYFYGGAELLRKTLGNNFGIEVDGTVAVDFRALVSVIDQLGGVPVALNDKERSALNALLKEYNRDYGYARDHGLVMEAGEQLLDGKQALCFSRIRKLDSDFVRTDRQRRVLEGMLSRVQSLSLPKLLAVAGKAWGSLTTDLGFQDMVSLLPLVMGNKDITISGMQIPINGGYQDEVINGMMVLVPNLKKNVQAMEKFLK